MEHHIYQVDAFTNKPFSGNPAAVCMLDAPADETWMQNMAGEMNLSETAFLYREDDGFRLRWFTPAVEVDLCGHATLASAHILWESGYLWPAEKALFHTRSGLLTAERNGLWIELDFPSTPPEETEPLPGLVEALGVDPVFVGKSKYDFIIQVGTEEEVRCVQPAFESLRSIPARGVILTSLADDRGYDFVSRYFAPAFGINEDPVTGSAHCCLAPHWSSVTGKDKFVAYQASARGGEVRARLAGDRVILGGQAVTVLRGELT